MAGPTPTEAPERTRVGPAERSTDGHTPDSVARAPMLAIGGWPAWLAIGGVTLLAVLGALVAPSLSVPRWARYAPLAVSLVVFGLPHGAVDHLAPARVVGDRPTGRWLAAVGLLYLVLGVAYAALWYVAPAVSAAFFIALTWFHWGQGDVYALDALGATHLAERVTRLGTLVVRGGLPMLVPLLRFPDRYRDVVDAWVALFGGGLDASWFFAPETRAVVGGAFAIVTLATLTLGRRHGGSPAWRRDAAETLLLWAYFLLVPPIVAVGIYFCVWHSLRHIARLVAIDPAARTAFAERGAVAGLRRTGRDALPLTALSIALLVGVAVGVGVQTDVRTLAALYLVFIAVLTLPHVAIVTWMDRAERAGLARLAAEQ